MAQALTACKEHELPVVAGAVSEAPLQNKAKDKPPLNLQAHIGSDTPFSSNDPIDQIKPYQAFIVSPNGEARPNGKRNFNDNAIKVGQKVADFTLHDPYGHAHNLKKTLLEGKPTFIMTGSYTCPTFRTFAIKELINLLNLTKMTSIFLWYIQLKGTQTLMIAPTQIEFGQHNKIFMTKFYTDNQRPMETVLPS